MVLLESNSNKKKYVKKIKCPYCEKRLARKELIYHVDRVHSDLIPENFTATRVVFNTINHKEKGTCIICGKESAWDESKGRYDRLCSNPKCHETYLTQVRSRMYNKYGTTNLITDKRFAEEQQKKMLANRRISGTYKFQNGDTKTYTGSYEKNCLEFMDTVLNCKSEDIVAPGPTIEYTLNGINHLYISDIYYVPYNLIIEIKDGGDNPNTRSMEEYRAKQIAKEKAIIESGKYNYLRLTNNNFSQLLKIFAELKFQLLDGCNDPVIDINEMSFNSYLPEDYNKNMVNDINYITELNMDTIKNIFKNKINNFKKVYSNLNVNISTNDKKFDLDDKRYKEIEDLIINKIDKLCTKYNNDPNAKKEIRRGIDENVKRLRKYLESEGYTKESIDKFIDVKFEGYANSNKVPKIKPYIQETPYGKSVIEIVFNGENQEMLACSLLPIQNIYKDILEDKDVLRYCRSTPRHALNLESHCMAIIYFYPISNKQYDKIFSESMTTVGFMPPQGIDDVYVINHGKKNIFGNYDKLAVSRFKDLSNSITLDDLGNLVTLPDDYFIKNECKVYKVHNGKKGYQRILEDYLYNNSYHLPSYIYETMTGKKLLSMNQLDMTLESYQKELDIAKCISENVYYSITNNSKPSWKSVYESPYINYDVYVDENGYFFMEKDSHKYRTPSFNNYEELCVQGDKYIKAMEELWTI